MAWRGQWIMVNYNSRNGQLTGSGSCKQKMSDLETDLPVLVVKRQIKREVIHYLHSPLDYDQF